MLALGWTVFPLASDSPRPDLLFLGRELDIY